MSSPTPAGLGFNIIDADAHWDAQPRDLYQKRVAEKYRQRSPKVVKDDKGQEMLSYDDGRIMKRYFPLEGIKTISANPEMNVRDRTAGQTLLPDLSPVEQRLHDMALDGIHTSIIYSLDGFTLNKAYENDRDMILACVQAYNDFLIEEVAAPSNGRLVALCIMPQTGVKDAIAEAERCLKKGHKGVILGRWPNGSIFPEKEDDDFWSDVQGWNVPAAIHVVNDFMGENMGTMGGRFKNMTPEQLSIGAVNQCGSTTIPIVDTFLGQGIGERFPKLRIGLIESNIGWVPHFLEQIDNYWDHYRFTVGKSHLRMKPSEQFRQNFWLSFLNDPHGVANRHEIGLDKIMWSSDFPHGITSWPHSRAQISTLFKGIPKDELKMMLHDNAKTFYGLAG